MKLKSGRTFWPDNNRTFKLYPPLKKDVSCDIAIVGSGIVGALLAYHLTAKDRSVILIDKREIGLGSTSASTALLLYELDVHLVDLMKKIGKKEALRVYQLSLQSIATLRLLAHTLRIISVYRKKKSLYLASTAKDVSVLRKEYLLRKKHGFKVQLLLTRQLKKQFGIDAHAAILSDVAAEIDPYRLTHSLVTKALKRGLRIYSHTEVTHISAKGKENTLHTANGNICAQQVIMATGYESQKYIRKNIVDLKSSYVIVSEPIPHLKNHWLHDHLLWESARPYFYIRTTSDNRIMIGGEDEDIVDDKKRDALITKKATRLKQKFEELVPDIPFVIAYAWAGTFGETKDGMGYIGVPSEWKNIHFALGFGGNGITFGVVAAKMIAKTVTGRKTKDASLFSFDR